MKLTIQLFLVATLILFAASCKKIHADGPTVTKTLNLSHFTAVSSSIDATVTYSQSPEYRVEVSAQQAIHDNMRVEVVDGELRFYYPGSTNVGHHEPITIFVSGPDVSGFTINGSGELRVDSVAVPMSTARIRISGSGSVYIPYLNADALEATISGSGNVLVANGCVRRENCEISGSGDMDLYNVLAQDVTARISGSGSVYTYAKNSLDVHISGSGNVYYRGTPRITTSISGSGKLQPR